MSYGAHVSPLEKNVVDGRSYVSFTITERDVTETDEAVVECMPPYYTITLFEAEITEQPSAADTTINPRLATSPGSNPGALALVAQNQNAAASIRNVGGVRVTSMSRRLYIRSKPPAGVTVPVVVTRITLVQGMDIQTAVAVESAPKVVANAVVWSAVDDADDTINAAYGGPINFSRYLTMPPNIVQRGDVLRLWFHALFESDNAAPEGDEVDGLFRLKLGDTIVAMDEAKMSNADPVHGLTYAEIRFERAGLSALTSIRFWKKPPGDTGLFLTPDLPSPFTLDTTVPVMVRASFGWEHGDLTGATAKQILIAAMLFRGEP